MQILDANVTQKYYQHQMIDCNGNVHHKTYHGRLVDVTSVHDDCLQTLAVPIDVVSQSLMLQGQPGHRAVYTASSLIRQIYESEVGISLCLADSGMLVLLLPMMLTMFYNFSTKRSLAVALLIVLQ